MFDEKKLQTVLKKKVEKLFSERNESCLLEYKCKGKLTLNFKSHFQPQQLYDLYKAKHSHLYYKIPDVSVTAKPADAFILCKASAYVVLAFYDAKKQKKPDKCYFIDIDKILLYKVTNKSISQTQAETLSDIIISI